MRGVFEHSYRVYPVTFLDKVNSPYQFVVIIRCNYFVLLPKFPQIHPDNGDKGRGNSNSSNPIFSIFFPLE